MVIYFNNLNNNFLFLTIVLTILGPFYETIEMIFLADSGIELFCFYSWMFKGVGFSEGGWGLWEIEILGISCGGDSGGEGSGLFHGFRISDEGMPTS